jgi:hypothetical protein
MSHLVSIAMLFCTLVAGLGAFAEPFESVPYTDGDSYADTWVATDALGRSQPGFDEVGAVNEDKTVAIFYWTWHVPRPGGPNDNTKIIAAAGDSETIEWPSQHSPHHWGEPELGYYRMTDPFVIRKHASMLSDAGVDVVLFDTTNPPMTWKDEYEALCRTYTEMRAEGARTPQIGFITPFWDPAEVTEIVYRDLYAPGLWSDLWFRWEGKPFILANKEKIQNPAILDFFTFRRPMPDYWDGPSGPDQWSWLEVYPQHVFLNSAGEAEQMSVGVGQNALPNTPGPAPMSHKAGAMGRSWHKGAKDTRENAVEFGLNFQEQWDRALEVDPQIVFVTGWNEWVAGRYTEWSTYTDADAYYPGGLFIDQYTQEYSRDCEPMRGGHTDNYYYQLAANVRKFKGVRPLPTAGGPHAIEVDGSLEEWAAVTPEFRDTIGDVAHRDHLGYGDIHYTNDTGRNDFVLSKAAYDDAYLYFFAQTSAPITPQSDAHWMLLLIDADQDAATGWLGYDFVVNDEVTSDTETTVKAWREGAWEKIGGAEFQVNGNGLEVAVSRDIVGEGADAPAFDFHWADNIQGYTDVSELGVHGDSAPNRRWNYRYTVNAPARPEIKKLGTIDVDLVETSPVVFNDRVYRYEYVRHGYWNNQTGDSYFRFVDHKTNTPTTPFGTGYHLGSAFVDGDRAIVTAVDIWDGERIHLFTSTDLETWEDWEALHLPGYGLFNTSLCKAEDKYVLMFEVGKPEEVSGAPFTARFATSPDLKEWTLTAPECTYAKDRYTAPHCLRYLDGYYYNFYLEAVNGGYEQYVVRSKDLIDWQQSPLNPVLAASPEDKQIANETLSEAHRKRIADATNLNNSDIDFCEFEGRLIINYSWGNQQGVEHLAEAVYEGTEAAFLRGWFPEE